MKYAFSRDRAAFLQAHNIEQSMSRRGNCHDNAVAESFFNLLKRARIRRRTYKTREQTRQDIFDDIEMLYNPKRKHARNAMLSPVDFENRQRNVNQEGVYETRRYSKRLKSPRHAQRFLAGHDQINAIFKPRRYLLSASYYRHAREDAFRLRAECAHGVST